VADVLTLRYPYEVRDEKPYFEDIPDLKLSKEMLDLATHIVQTKSGHFDPTRSVACVKEKLATY
jgi:DNA end-binding protein Ku